MNISGELGCFPVKKKSIYHDVSKWLRANIGVGLRWPELAMEDSLLVDMFTSLNIQTRSVVRIYDANTSVSKCSVWEYYDSVLVYEKSHTLGRLYTDFEEAVAYIEGLLNA